MAKIRRIPIAVLLIAVMGVFTWMASRQRHSEPVYEGKPLSFWLDGYRINNVLVFPKADEAVQQTGTNAIPTLLRFLRARDSKWKIKLITLAQRYHVIKINFVEAESRNYAAMKGFRVLGADARDAVPALVKILEQNISEDSQYYTAVSLGSIGPSAKEATPGLLRIAADTKNRSRRPAAQALAKIQAEPELAVPVLIKLLQDPKPGVRLGAADSLRLFGTDAKSAVPALINTLQDVENTVRDYATNALKAIDPEAAAKVGI